MKVQKREVTKLRERLKQYRRAEISEYGVSVIAFASTHPLFYLLVNPMLVPTRYNVYARLLVQVNPYRLSGTYAVVQ